MKILFVFSTPAGGMQTLNYERNVALSRKGLECHFLYLRPHFNGDQLKEDHVFITSKVDEIKQLIRIQIYEAIIVCTYFRYLEMLTKVGYKGKLIYEFQGIGDLQATKQWIKKSKICVTKYADAIMFPKTRFLINLMKKHFPNKKLFSFHNCIDINLFDYKEVLTPKNTILGWVGRLDANKNWQEFLVVGASLRKTIPNLQLWLFHDPASCSNPSKQAFSKMVTELNLTDSLVIYENTPRVDMPRYYSMIANSGGLLCSTSKREGFGYAIIESMCCKCPVLTTRSGGAENFVFHNKTGKLYTQGNINHCIKNATDLIANMKLRREIIESAYHFVRSSFTPELYVHHFVQMLQSIG